MSTKKLQTNPPRVMCERTDCKAYAPKQLNKCAALSEIYPYGECKFYKRRKECQSTQFFASEE